MIRNSQCFSDFPTNSSLFIKNLTNCKIFSEIPGNFLGILRNFQGELEFLGIPSLNYHENSHLSFLEIPRNSLEFLGVFSQKFFGNSKEVLGILKVTSQAKLQVFNYCWLLKTEAETI